MSANEMAVLTLLALCCLAGVTGVFAALIQDDMVAALRFYLVSSVAAGCAVAALLWRKR